MQYLACSRVEPRADPRPVRQLPPFRAHFQKHKIYAHCFLVLDVHHVGYAVQAPEICTLYALNVPATLVRARIREQFEKNRHITDPNVVDMLLIKGHNEWQETMNCWKMESHLLGILLEDRKVPQRSFMDKFLEGTCHSPASCWYHNS